MDIRLLNMISYIKSAFLQKGGFCVALSDYDKV